jgi:hypothetical protein
MNGVATMLHEFLKTHRTELITRCRAKAAKRSHARTPDNEFGIPQFLAQLIETFRVEQTPEAVARHKALGPGKPSLALVPSDIAGTAARHGEEMRRQGLTIDQVVHGYGDMCQALTELAMEKDAPITVDEFHTFNRCLDDAIADAVTAFSRDPDASISKPDIHAANEPRGSRIQVIRTLIETAIQSFAAIKSGSVGVNGTTAAMHERSLAGLRNLVDGLSADSGAAGTPATKKGHSPS